jgi:hypothetical protein
MQKLLAHAAIPNGRESARVAEHAAPVMLLPAMRHTTMWEDDKLRSGKIFRMAMSAEAAIIRPCGRTEGIYPSLNRPSNKEVIQHEAQG